MADMTAQQLITQALLNAGAIGAEQTATDTDLQDGLLRLRSMLRAWSAGGQMVYAVTQDSHALTSGTQNYTIGSGATIDTARPVRIKGAFVRDSNGTDHLLEIIDESKYRGLGTKGLGYTYPAYLYYNPTYPLGTIYLYPPGGGTLYIDSLKPLTDPTTLTGDVEFPGEYDEAIEWGLTIRMCPSYGRDPTLFMYDMAERGENAVLALNAALSVESVSTEIIKLTRSYNIDSDGA